MPQIYFSTKTFKAENVLTDYNDMIRDMLRNEVQLLRFIDNPCDLKNVRNFEKAALDGFNGWNLHHIAGEFVGSYKELKRLGLYYRQPSWAFEFLTVKEHRHRHSKSYKYDRV